jgi:selenide,water dikinase
MAKGSRVQIELAYERLPVYPNAVEMYRRGETTGSNAANRRLAEEFLEVRTRLSREEEELLFEPQTSGGLLFSIPSSQADTLITLLKESGVEAAGRVGEIIGKGEPRIHVI